MVRDLQTGKFKRPIIKLPAPNKPNKKRTAAAFAGAGARILYECGAAEAIRDIIKSGKMDELVTLTGTSSGVITSAFYASKQLDVLHDLCLTIRNKDIYSWAPWKLFTKEACLFDNAPLRKTLESNLNCQALRDFCKDGNGPILANITDLTKWHDIEPNLCVLNDEDIIDAIIKSTSVPGAFPVLDNCVDGGVVDNYPIFDALAQQVDRIILISTSAVEIAPVHNIRDILSQFISITMYNQLSSAKRMLELVHLKNPDIQLTELIIVEPKTPLNIGLLDADHLGTVEQREAFIKIGYDLTMEALKDINDNG